MIFGRASSRRGGRRRCRRRVEADDRDEPAAGRVRPRRRDAAAVPLVADGLLSDSRHRDLHDRARARCRSSSASFDRTRPLPRTAARSGGRGGFCARRASRSSGRARRCRRSPRAASSSRITPASMTFRSSSRRCRASCASWRRRRSATCRSSAGTCAASRTPAGRSQESGRVDLQADAAPDDAGRLAPRVSGGIAHARRAREEVQGRRLSAGDRDGLAGRAAQHRRQPRA